jgi:hypothetical protein
MITIATFFLGFSCCAVFVDRMTEDEFELDSVWMFFYSSILVLVCTILSIFRP